MRNRLVVALVGITAAVIALYGVPRAYFLADLVHTQEQRKLERSAELLSALITEREEDGRPVSAAYLRGLLFTGESVRYDSPEGSSVSAGPSPGDHALVETRELPGGGTITLRRVGSLVDARVSQALMPLVLIGLVLMGASAVVGWLLARRLSRPFQELAGAATNLGRGDFDLELREYSIPEAARIAEALRRSAAQLQDLVRRERDFAVNASHELRTPVTALRLQMEDLTMWPETPPEVAQELNSYLAQLDRLNAAIDRHLDSARSRREQQGVEVDVDGVLADAVRRWSASPEAEGRRLVHRPSGPGRVHLDAAALRGVLDALIGNALRDGEGTVTLASKDGSAYLVVSVADEGGRRMDSGVFHHASRDGVATELTGAAELAESLGGRLSLEAGEANTFTLRLPKDA